MNKLGKYDLQEKIGAGGYGVVFKGYDPFIKRTVAIKTCSSDDERVRLRFYREAEIAGNLIHPNITTIYDFGIQDNVPFLVEEFLTGEDLDHKIKRRAEIPIPQRLDYLIQVARGLEYAHSQGVVHRDIKPGNIRVLDNERAKIMDFGTAKLANVESQLTQAGMTLGTAAYISPEQIQGTDVGLSADLFSFGVTAFELLTYERPFDGRKIATVLHQILNETPRPVVTLWPECPADLARLLDRCLEKDPRKRFPRAVDLVAALQEVIHEYAANRRSAVAEARTLFLEAAGQQPPPEMPPATPEPVAPPRAVVELPRTPSGQMVDAPSASDDLPLTTAAFEITPREQPISRVAATPTGGGKQARPATGGFPTPPVPQPTAPPPPPPPPARREESTGVSVLLDRARQLQQSRELDRAVLAAAQAVAAAPGDSDAHELLRTVEEDLRAEVDRERRRRAVTERVAGIVDLIDRQNIPRAEEALAAAERDLGQDAPELAPARVRLEEHLRQRRSAAAGTALAKAEKQMDRGQYRAAKTTLLDALASDPDNADLAVAVAAADRLLVRSASQTGAVQQDAVASIEALIDRGRLDEARQAIAFAGQMFGEDFAGLERLSRRVDERGTQLALRKELSLRVDRAGAIAARGDYAGAMALLAEVEQEDPKYPGLGALLAATRQALALADENRRRLQAVTEATAAIEGHIRRLELDRAEEALTFAEDRLAPFEPGQRLRSLLAEEQQRQRRAAQGLARRGLETRLRRAQQLLTSGEFAAAIRLLRQVLEEHPESEEVEVMLSAAKEAQARGAESDRREQAIVEATASVETHLSGGDTEAARQALEFAIELLGPTSELVTLRKRVTQAELSSTAVRTRAGLTRETSSATLTSSSLSTGNIATRRGAPGATSKSKSLDASVEQLLAMPTPSSPPPAREATEVDALLAIARTLLNAGQRGAAERTVEAALDLDPENRDARALLAAAREAVSRS